MSVTCKRGKQGSRGTGEDDVGRSLRKTWARCLVSLFIGRPLPACRAGCPGQKRRGGQTVPRLHPTRPPAPSPLGTSSHRVLSPVRLSCPPASLQAKGSLRLFMLRYWGRKVLSAGHQQSLRVVGFGRRTCGSRSDLLLLTRFPPTPIR